MKQGKVFSLWQLICSETAQKISIPQIQRDYIQYRSGHVETNLNRFVSNLIEALVKDCEINLNFVYGNVERGFDIKNKTSYDAFCPIDGQQRLTTLFLLHYYVFNEADRIDQKNKLKGNLIYHTRNTTQDFFEALLEKNTIKFSKPYAKPSTSIRESGWYTSLWDFDPSVLSCLKVLDVIHEKFQEKLGNNSVNFSTLSNKLTSNRCPITFMKLELEKLDNPNELYIKMNSRGKQLTSFENFKSELFRMIKEKKDNYPAEFKAKIDGDWLELIWELCDKSDKYTDVFYRDLLHVCFMNSLIASLPSNEKAYIEVLDYYTRRQASSFYIEDYKEFFEKCNNSKNSGEEMLTGIIAKFYYTMECIYILSKNDSDTYEEVANKLFSVGKDNKKNDISKLDDYRDNYIPHALLESVCVFANSTASKVQIDKKAKLDISEYISRFKDWWRVANNLITNAEIDDIISFVSSLRELNTIKYSYFVSKYLNILQDDDGRYIYLDSSLKDSQKKEEILKQKIINLGGTKWADAIRTAERHNYFNGEINFALKLTEITCADNINSTSAAEFSNNWKIVENIFVIAEKNDILMHRVLLSFGDYSKKISSYSDGKDYLLTYYSYSEKHHNQDWRGLLRDEDGFVIFKEMFNSYKNSGYNDFEEYAKNIVKAPKQSSTDDLNYYLIKDEKMFSYTQAFRCWHYFGELRLLKTSKRSDYYDYKMYAIYAAKKLNGLEIHEGANTSKDCYLSYKGKEYIIRKDCLYDRNEDVSSLASGVDNMIKYLEAL